MKVKKISGDEAMAALHRSGVVIVHHTHEDDCPRLRGEDECTCAVETDFFEAINTEGRDNL